MTPRIDRHILPVLLIAVFNCGAAAPTSASRAVVFKDGYALIVKSWSAVTDERGEIHVDDVPDAAVLGSFWATAAQGKLLGMRAGHADVKEEWTSKVSVTEHLQILAANPGKNVEIRYSDRTYVGKIGPVLATKTMVGDRTAQGVTHEKLAGQSFVLRTPDGDVILSTAGIRVLVIPDVRLDMSRKSSRVERTKRLTLRFAEKGVRRNVTLTYFRPGIRWIPTYRMDLADEKQARLSLQAELINEVEDLTDVSIDVVVGVPNFRFKDTVSPLILESVMKRALHAAAPQLMGQVSNSFSNASYGLRSTEHRAAAAATAPKVLGDSSRHDSFVFPLGVMTLKKGERAAVPIFERSVPYRHVYTWDLHLKKNDYANTPSAAGVNSPLDIAKNEVWHQIELENDGETAWTTGAVMIMDGHRPLAQELLTYTSIGDKVRVPVTISVETRGTASDRETGRRLGALKWADRKYARINNLAKLELCNHKGSAVDVEITLRLGGRATKASQGGAIELHEHRRADWSTYRGAAAVNNSSTIRWTKRLGPGELFKPTVAYRYFTPS